MAKKTTTSAVATFRGGKKVSRPGRHSKCKQTGNKSGKNYSKPYAGQGR